MTTFSQLLKQKSELKNKELSFVPVVNLKPSLTALASCNDSSQEITYAQKAIKGLKLRNHLIKQEKCQLRKEGRHLSTNSDSLPTLSRNQKRLLRKKAAKQLGISSKSILKAIVIKKYAPELLDVINYFNGSLDDVYEKARKVKYSMRENGEPSIAYIVYHDGDVAEYTLPIKSFKFNDSGKRIAWAKLTWNPITGCIHNCSFCYAFANANTGKMKDYYPRGFKPAFHQYRLVAPENTAHKNKEIDERRVFVGSMADIFGKWVPDEWIYKIFDTCEQNPQWEYIFLTKFPQRYSHLEDLPHAWYGASVVNQKDVRRIEKAMTMFETTGFKWLSVEPMQERIRFNDLSWCDVVVIGPQTGANGEPGFQPKKEWIDALIKQCNENGVIVFLKPNLKYSPRKIERYSQLPCILEEMNA